MSIIKKAYNRNKVALKAVSLFSPCYAVAIAIREIYQYGYINDWLPILLTIAGAAAIWIALIIYENFKKS